MDPSQSQIEWDRRDLEGGAADSVGSAIPAGVNVAVSSPDASTPTFPGLSAGQPGRMLGAPPAASSSAAAVQAVLAAAAPTAESSSSSSSSAASLSAASQLPCSPALLVGPVAQPGGAALSVAAAAAPPCPMFVAEEKDEPGRRTPPEREAVPRAAAALVGSQPMRRAGPQEAEESKRGSMQSRQQAVRPLAEHKPEDARPAPLEIPDATEAVPRELTATARIQHQQGAARPPGLLNCMRRLVVPMERPLPRLSGEEELKEGEGPQPLVASLQPQQHQQPAGPSQVTWVRSGSLPLSDEQRTLGGFLTKLVGPRHCTPFQIEDSHRFVPV